MSPTRVGTPPRTPWKFVRGWPSVSPRVSILYSRIVSSCLLVRFFTTEMARRTLARHNWNLSRVAQELGITRPTLYALIRKHRFRETGASKV